MIVTVALLLTCHQGLIFAGSAETEGSMDKKAPAETKQTEAAEQQATASDQTEVKEKATTPDCQDAKNQDDKASQEG